MLPSLLTWTKDEQCIKNLRLHLIDKDVKPEQIEQFGIDMSPSFISGIQNNFPKSAITFDRFHVVKLLNPSSPQKVQKRLKNRKTRI